MVFMAPEEGILKLVHPGGFVEIHHHPVMASQVMSKNPRHFVTRPDVFKFPWIVVRPESVLKPGNAFFIVPCHTLYRLLHASTPNPSAAVTTRAGRRSHQGLLGAYDMWAEASRKPCLKKNNEHGRSTTGDRRVTFYLPDGCIYSR